jgi:hypothetical protein
MKKIFTLLLGLLPLYSLADSIEITGAEMTYQYIGGHDYEVKLNIYTRCSQDSMDAVYITVSSPGTSFKSYKQLATLKDMGEVFFQCGPKPFVSKCQNSGATLDGFRKWTATAQFTLYTGLACEYTFSWQSCCRSASFTNGGAGEPLYIDAYANLCNNYKLSSPQFEPEYSPWLMSNVCATKFNNAIVPVGSNSTYSYQLVPAKMNTDKSVTYTSPYTYRKPATNNGGFNDADLYDTAKDCWGVHLDNVTGALEMYPLMDHEIFPVAVDLIKFTNGKMVSKVTRDLLYWVIPFGGSNRPPVVTGIDCQTKDEITYEPNESKCFTICSFDAEDTVSLSAYWDMPKNAMFTVEEGKKWPKGQFCWRAELSDLRDEPYKLIVHVEDDYCREVFGLESSSFTEKTILIYVKDLHGHFGFGETGSPFNLKIFPQPATSKVYAEVPERNVRKVTLIDMTGKSFTPQYSFTHEKLEIDIASLRAGTYLLQAVTDKIIYSGRVIVTR